MTQTINRHPRAGWQQDEIELLFGAVKEASELGQPLRNVFADVGERLSRKPNSIRNYYYARVRETPALAPMRSPFRSFDAEELNELLRNVLMGRARGESVRACVTRLANGDRSGMLRYQNKYRSILKGKPEMLMAVADELRAAGLPCPQDVLCTRRKEQKRAFEGGVPEALVSRMGDPCVRRMVDALCELLRREEASAAHRKAEGLRSYESGAELDVQELERKWLEARRETDRLRVEVDLLKLALEDAQNGVGAGSFAAEVGDIE